MKNTVYLLLFCLLALCASPLVDAANRKPRPRRTSAKSTAAKDKRIYLVHADVLHYNQYMNRDAQILNGKVQFMHQGAKLFCDSAHFYEASNSFEAFGHVRMYQGDTLSLVSDYAYYDGDDQMAQARYNVVLKNRKTTLYTDSLNFDRLYNTAYFFEGGKLVDQSTTLTSDWGEYNTESKMAVFNFDVKMRGEDYYLTSDTLYYDTRQSVAHIVGPTNITSGKSKIYSERGYYDTKTERARLMDRSVLRNEGKMMVGDSIYYGGENGVSKAFRNVIFTDSINKNRILCDYGEYEESTGYAMCTERAVSIDFSQKDTLYMHADTFKIFTYNMDTDSVYRKVHAYNKVRAYRVDLQAVCDSLVYNQLDSCMTMYHDPIVWNMNQQLVGEEIQMFMNDSVINRAHVINQAFTIEQLRDTMYQNQVSSKEMFAFFDDGEIRETRAVDNVRVIFYPEDDADSSYIAMNYTETTELRMFMENRKMSRIWMPAAEGTMYPLSQIPPGKNRLEGYAWFDYVRPLNKDDIFNWRPKAASAALKPVIPRTAPLQQLDLPPAAPPAEPPAALAADSTAVAAPPVDVSATDPTEEDSPAVEIPADEPAETPAEDSPSAEIPADEPATPAEEPATPAEELSTPAEELSALAEELSALAEELSTPAVLMSGDSSPLSVPGGFPAGESLSASLLIPPSWISFSSSLTPSPIR